MDEYSFYFRYEDENVKIKRINIDGIICSMYILRRYSIIHKFIIHYLGLLNGRDCAIFPCLVIYVLTN